MVRPYTLCPAWIRLMYARMVCRVKHFLFPVRLYHYIHNLCSIAETLFRSDGQNDADGR
jgi:hypothetical protein